MSTYGNRESVHCHDYTYVHSRNHAFVFSCSRTVVHSYIRTFVHSYIRTFHDIEHEVLRTLGTWEKMEDVGGGLKEIGRKGGKE